MTDFRKIDLTVASTRGNTVHSVGFDVRIADWNDMKKELRKLDSKKTLKFREENLPRGHLNDQWKFVWVIMTMNTSLSVLLYLGSLHKMSYPAIQLRPREFP